MKQEMKHTWNRIWITLSVFLFSTLATLSAKAVEIDVNVHKQQAWYTSPWVWIVGAAIFILLLAAIIRGGRASD